MTTEQENQQHLYELKGRVADAISLIERELRYIGAEGTGVKELVNSVEKTLPYDIKRNILWCNKIRNRLLHPDKQTGYIRIPTEKEYEYFRQNIKGIMDYFFQQKNINAQKNSINNNDVKSTKEKDEVSNVLSGLDNAWSNLSLAGKILTVAGSIVALPFLAFGYYWLRDKLDI